MTSELLRRQKHFFSVISHLVEKVNDFPMDSRLAANHKYASLITELAAENFENLLIRIQDRFLSRESFDFLINKSSQLAASIRIPKNGNRPVVKHSLGTFLAVSDLTARLCSNKNFINFEFGPDNQINQRERGPLPMYARGPWLLKPRMRYFDYTPIESEGGEFAGPVFCTGIPMQSPSHFHLATLMLEIAVAWIQRHEEHHFALGHFNYSAHQGAKNIRELELSTEDLYGGVSLKSMLMELDADYNATRDIITEYFFDAEVVAAINEYFKFPKIAVLRVILQSIFMVILVFDKARQNAGGHSSGSHPKPITRILNVMRALYQEFNEIVNGHEMSVLAERFIADKEYSWIINASFEHTRIFATIGEISTLLAADISVISNVVSWEDGNAEGPKSYRHYLQSYDVAASTFGDVRTILNAVEQGLLSDDFDRVVQSGLRDAHAFQDRLMHDDERQLYDGGSLAEDASEYAFLMKSWHSDLGVEISTFADRESPVLRFPTVRWISRHRH